MGGGKREREGGEEGEATTLVDFYLYFAFELYGISCGFTGLEMYSLNTGTGTVTLAWPTGRILTSGSDEGVVAEDIVDMFALVAAAAGAAAAAAGRRLVLEAALL